QAGRQQFEAIEEWEDFVATAETHGRGRTYRDFLKLGLGCGVAAVGTELGKTDVAARRHAIPELSHNPSRVVVIGHEVEQADEEHQQRLVEVDELLQLRVIEEPLRLADVLL